MKRKSKRNPEISTFILQQVEKHPHNIATLTATEFGITRVSVSRYISQLVKDKLLTYIGNTKARNYKLIETVDEKFHFTLPLDNKEDVIWREKCASYFSGLNKNIIDICQYGVTEIINNVIDHSATEKYFIEIKKNPTRVFIRIRDYGVGIFEKIRLSYDLLDKRHALLELSKGKLTSDPKNHNGEGIFFTSRIFEQFTIMSGDLVYIRKIKDKDEWLIETKDQKNILGTSVMMEININAAYTIEEIFNKYTDDEYRFSRTHVPIRLARYGDEQLISRSQAKRVLARFENFSEVIMDFNDVTKIGQGFADEIFRVYKNSHPEIKILAVRTTPQIDNMIKHVEIKLKK